MPGVDGVKAVRALLKTALRRFGLRAIDVRQSANSRCRTLIAWPRAASRAGAHDAVAEASAARDHGFFALDGSSQRGIIGAAIHAAHRPPYATSGRGGTKQN